MHTPAAAETATYQPPIDFMWLELTNQCNLQCTHCYAESGPQGEKATLTTAQFIALMNESFALGCHRIQFIGGEPTLNRDLPLFIRTATQIGFEFIEVYTNLTILPEELLECFVENGVHVATSVYGPAGKPHDAITLVDGSWERTIKNLGRVMKAGLPVRASIVEMESNAAYTEATVDYLREMGVQNVSVGRIRHIGRGAAPCEGSEMSELCGNCAGGTICISPSGVVSPCIMSQRWAVGSITETSLSEIANGDSLRDTRQQIYQAVMDKQGSISNRHAACAPTYEVLAQPTACEPTAPLVGQHADCQPSALLARSECAPTVAGVADDLCTPVALGARSACVPSYAGMAKGADCDPSAVLNLRSMTKGGDCQPSVVLARSECGPLVAGVADDFCTPVTLGARSACVPSYSGLAKGGDCHPTALLARPECGPLVASVADDFCTPIALGAPATAINQR